MGRAVVTPAGVDLDGCVTRRDFTLEVTLAVAPGTTLALVGPNGAGKSTTLATLAGLVPLDAGRLRLAGRVVDEPSSGTWVPPEQRSVGVVFQHLALLPHLRVVDDVAFGARVRGVRRRAARREAERWLERVGLDPGVVARRRSRELSGGEAQRVALARALATEPSVLVLDEPLSAVDASARPRLRADLRRVLDGHEGAAVVVTHDAVEAAALADEIAVVEDGRVVQRGGAGDLARRPASRYVADLLGVNLLAGRASGTTVRLAGGAELVVPEAADGPVTAVVHPRSVALHLDRPGGTPRNAWPGTVSSVERDPAGDRVRVHVDGAVPLVAEVTAAAAASLGLAPGAPVWAAVKATEVDVHPG